VREGETERTALYGKGCNAEIARDALVNIRHINYVHQHILLSIACVMTVPTSPYIYVVL
jgi:hypothetical protein